MYTGSYEVQQRHAHAWVEAYLDGRWGWDEAARRAVTATRQLAKRQLTWLRGQRSWRQIEAGDPAVLDGLRCLSDRLLKVS